MIAHHGNSFRSNTEQGTGEPKPCIISVLIAHRDPLIAAGLAALLRKRRDFKAVVYRPASISQGMASHLSLADVVVADYDYGLRLIESAGAGRHRVMILTHYTSEGKIRRALEQGVRGYVLLGGCLQNLIDGLRSIHAGGVAVGPLVVSRMADWMKQRTLTRREEEILRQLTFGFSNKLIATKLALAIGTVKTHVKAIMQKLDARSRTEAAAIAHRRGILGDEYECPPPEVRPAEIGMRPGATQHRDYFPDTSRTTGVAQPIVSFSSRVTGSSHGLGTRVVSIK
jgi:DNA-binding NarL/FixJ family response regulator